MRRNDHFDEHCNRALAITATVACALLFLGTSLTRAQTPPDVKTAQPSVDLQETNRLDAEARIEILNRQLAALTQIVNQNQRGIVVYPIALALPGPINCQGNCANAVSQICTAVRYPKSYAYSAVVPPDVIGTYANGICFGP